MSAIVGAEAAAQDGDTLLPSAELAKHLGLTLAASVVLTFSTIVYMHAPATSLQYAQSSYALSVGLVSFATCVAALLVYKFAPATLTKALCRIGKLGTMRPQHLLAFFLSAWWSAGAFLLTFWGPFLSTQNGYFAAWAGLFTSMSVLAATSARVSARLTSLHPYETEAFKGHNVRALLALLVCSTVLIVGCAFVMGEIWGGAIGLDAMYGNAIFGLVVGILSAVIVLAYLFMQDTDSEKFSPTPRRLAAGLLVVMWLGAAALLTFDGPFLETGNGYFACWLGLGAACITAVEELAAAAPGTAEKSDANP